MSKEKEGEKEGGGLTQKGRASPCRSARQIIIITTNDWALRTENRTKHPLSAPGSQAQPWCFSSSSTKSPPQRGVLMFRYLVSETDEDRKLRILYLGSYQ